MKAPVLPRWLISLIFIKKWKDKCLHAHWDLVSDKELRHHYATCLSRIRLFQNAKEYAESFKSAVYYQKLIDRRKHMLWTFIVPQMKKRGLWEGIDE